MKYTTLILAILAIQSQAAVIKKRDHHKEPKSFYPISTMDTQQQKDIKMNNNNRMMMTEVWYPSYGKSGSSSSTDQTKKNMNEDSPTTSSNQFYGETLNSGRRFRYVDDVPTPPSASSLSSLSTDSSSSSSSSSSKSLINSKTIEPLNDPTLGSVENINIKQKSETKPKKLMDTDYITDDLTDTDNDYTFIVDDLE